MVQQFADVHVCVRVCVCSAGGTSASHFQAIREDEE